MTRLTQLATLTFTWHVDELPAAPGAWLVGGPQGSGSRDDSAGADALAVLKGFNGCSGLLRVAIAAAAYCWAEVLEGLGRTHPGTPLTIPAVSPSSHEGLELAHAVIPLTITAV